MRNYLTDELEVAPALDSQLRDAAVRHSLSSHPQAVLAIRPGRPWPTQTRSWPTQTARIIPMIPTYTTSVVLPKICLAFDWPTQTKIPRTACGCDESEWRTAASRSWLSRAGATSSSSVK